MIFIAAVQCTSAGEDHKFATARAISINPVMNTGLKMALAVPADHRYAVQATSDFVFWTEIGNGTATNGVFEFLDEWVSVGASAGTYCSEAGCFPFGPFYWVNPEQRFYRLLDLTEPEIISGHVSDAEGNLISNAKISIVGGKASAVSDATGAFSIEVGTTEAPARIFVAETPGYIAGVAQPTYLGTSADLDFHLAPQTASRFAPQSLTGRTIILADRSRSVPTDITFMDEYRTDNGLYYVSTRSGDDFDVYQLRPSGLFQWMTFHFGFPGGGAMSPASWFNAGGGYAMSPIASFVDASDRVSPPAELHDHRVNLRFLYGLWDVMGPWSQSGELKLSGSNSGEFLATNFLQRLESGSYSYSVTSNIATLSLISGAESIASSYTFIFTSQTAGRFVYVNPTIGAGYVGTFENFFPMATSGALTASIEYHWPVLYSQEFNLTLGDSSTGFRFFTDRSSSGTYTLSSDQVTPTLALRWGEDPMSVEIDTLHLNFETATSGSISGEMQTAAAGEIKTYPITGTFANFSRP